MSPRTRTYLCDARDKALFLLELFKLRTLEEVENDRILCAAIERELMIIGEAVYLLNECDADTASQLTELRQMIALRHKLVHGYSTVSPEIMWRIIEHDLPPLVAEIDALLL